MAWIISKAMNTFADTKAVINNIPVIIFNIFCPPCGIKVIMPRNPDFKKPKPYLITRLFSFEITYTGLTKNSQLRLDIQPWLSIDSGHGGISSAIASGFVTVFKIDSV